MYNKLKIAQSRENALRERTQEDGMATDFSKPFSITDSQLDSDRTTVPEQITENELGGVRDKVPETITQNQIDDGKSNLTVLRDDSSDHSPVHPLALLNAAHEAEHLKAVQAADKDTLKDDTSFWDKYVEEQMLEPCTTQVGKMGPSQLQNNPDRFGKQSTDPHKVDGDKVSRMVMASLLDADTMLFDIFVKSAGRDLTTEEQQLVDGISRDKAKLLVACGDMARSPSASTGGMGGSNIEGLARFIRDPKTPHDEKWEAARAKFEELAGNSSGPKMASADSESRYEKNFQTGKLEVKKSIWDKERAKCPKCKGGKRDCPRCHGEGTVRR